MALRISLDILNTIVVPVCTQTLYHRLDQHNDTRRLSGHYRLKGPLDTDAAHIYGKICLCLRCRCLCLELACRKKEHHKKQDMQSEMVEKAVLSLKLECVHGRDEGG